MKKVVLIVGCLLILCCCFSIVGFFAIFGHFELNGKCAYKGPSATPTSGACAPAPSNSSDNNNDANPNTSDAVTYVGYYSESFTFAYDEDDFTFSEDITATPPIKLFSKSDDGFFDNINLTVTDDLVSLDAFTCADLLNSVANGIEDSDANFTVTGEYSQITTLNSQPACLIYWLVSDSASGEDFYQYQYYIPNESMDETYIMTLSFEMFSEYEDSMFNVADSFKIK